MESTGSRTAVDLPVPPSTMDLQVPVAPAPRKPSALKLGVLALGAVVVLGGIGTAVAVSSKDEPAAATTVEQPSTGTGGHLEPGESLPESESDTAYQAPVEDDLAISDAAGQSAPLANDAVRQFDAALKAMNNYDALGAAGHLERAAEDYELMSFIWDGVDEYISTTSDRIATELYSAAQATSDYRLPAATKHLSTATDLLNEVTAYTESLI
jgi:hypothetical protein